jgi:hypothetical protein
MLDWPKVGRGRICDLWRDGQNTKKLQPPPGVASVRRCTSPVLASAVAARNPPARSRLLKPPAWRGLPCGAACLGRVSPASARGRESEKVFSFFTASGAKPVLRLDTFALLSPPVSEAQIELPGMLLTGMRTTISLASAPRNAQNARNASRFVIQSLGPMRRSPMLAWPSPDHALAACEPMAGPGPTSSAADPGLSWLGLLHFDADPTLLVHP